MKRLSHGGTESWARPTEALFTSLSAGCLTGVPFADGASDKSSKNVKYAVWTDRRCRLNRVRVEAMASLTDDIVIILQRLSSYFSAAVFLAVVLCSYLVYVRCI